MRSGPRAVGVAALASVLMLGFPPPPASASPATDGLVLWLDAGDAGTLDVDAAGYVGRWADKSDRHNDARQTEPAARPQYAADGLGGKPAVRFAGSEFLNLGQPESLDFRPGDPFTIAVVYRVAAGQCGTFIAKGGGTAGQRAYQVYVAPNRQGAIAYGVMRESPITPGAKIAVEVCDGARAEVFVNGEPSLSFAAGGGSSEVDVLVGARRKDADNTGTFYPLTGDVAEILVYKRALDRKGRDAIGGYLKEKYGLESSYVDSGDADRLVAVLATPAAFARLDPLAESLARLETEALPPLRALLASHPEAAPATAELLVRMAEKNHLTGGFAELAAGLLRHDDPFVRGMAEWAIAMKVGGENNGQTIVWPGVQPPPWYDHWSSLPDAALLEADWVRQAVSHGIHRDPARLLASVDEMIDRADRMGAAFRRLTPSGECLPIVAQRLEELESVRRELAERIEAAPADRIGQHRLWIEARRLLRDCVLANPAVDFEGLLFVKQFAPHTVRNITRSYAWKHKPGGDLSILSDLKAGGPVRSLLQGRLGPGYVWGLDLWWDADRIVFGYARQPDWPPAVDTANYAIEGTNVFQLRKVHEPLHLFEIGVDGSGLKQLTDDPYWSDFEPTYCANGDVVFASDRCGRAAECGNDTYDHTNPNLYILSAEDGAIRQLTDSKDIDRYPHSLDDGRIAYTHWEYQERHFLEVHALWTLRPDGTMSDALFKHHMRAPYGLRDTRSVPNSQKLVSIATGHHTFAYGPVVVVDPAQGMNAEAGLRIVTPGVQPQEGPMAGTPVPEGGVPDRGGLYQTPWALSDDCFLAAYAYARPECTAPAGADSNGFAIYLIDVYGNRELIDRDPVLSCTFPIPLKRRRWPPILPDTRPEPTPHATCYVTDVYDGVQGVPRGTIKHLRIAQHVGWPFDDERGQMDYIPGNAGSKRIDFQSWSPVRVIGTVPVAPDGSACFTVPADTALYFQALDERRMEVVRMRSMVSFKAGEVRGCRGCHESQAKAPAAPVSLPAALAALPCTPTPPPWGAGKLLGYEWLVQPILDRHCVRCHGDAEPEGGLDFTATQADDGLLQSFRTMFGVVPGDKTSGRVLVSCSNRFSGAEVTRPKQFGSHRSPLVVVLLEDELHTREVDLRPAEWLSLVTWVDANAPYHDAFFNKRPAGGGRPKRDVTPQLALPFAFQADRSGFPSGSSSGPE